MEHGSRKPPKYKTPRQEPWVVYLGNWVRLSSDDHLAGSFLLSADSISHGEKRNNIIRNCRRIFCGRRTVAEGLCRECNSSEHGGYRYSCKRRSQSCEHSSQDLSQRPKRWLGFWE